MTGIEGRNDWLVHAKPPLNKEFEFATIRDVSCLEEVKKRVHNVLPVTISDRLH